MPYRETVEELTEALADLLGLYGQGRQFDGMSVAETRAFIEEEDRYDVDHAETCQCRGCWTAAMARRIRTAVDQEQRLAALACCTHREGPANGRA
jgi:hypothetical protein